MDYWHRSKKEYTRIISSQLSASEQTILFYHAC
ncbi:putative phage abortive infection protein [Paenibacillus sp. NRS-1781]